MSTHNIHFWIKKKTFFFLSKISLNICFHELSEEFPREFESATVKKPSMFESLMFYCTTFCPVLMDRVTAQDDMRGYFIKHQWAFVYCASVDINQTIDEDRLSSVNPSLSSTRFLIGALLLREFENLLIIHTTGLLIRLIIDRDFFSLLGSTIGSSSSTSGSNGYDELLVGSSGGSLRGRAGPGEGVSASYGGSHNQADLLLSSSIFILSCISGSCDWFTSSEESLLPSALNKQSVSWLQEWYLNWFLPQRTPAMPLRTLGAISYLFVK